MKALCYTTKLMSGLYASSNTEKSKKLAIFSSKISGARATLRYNDLRQSSTIHSLTLQQKREILFINYYPSNASN